MQTGPEHPGVNTVTMFVVVFLVVVGAIGGYWAYGVVSQPAAQTTTSNPRSSTTSSATSAAGIRFEESINASTIIGFQRLNISISLSNTRQSVNSIPTANDWFFTGVYTIAVADEWGQAVILHVTVLPGTGITSTSTSTSCSGSPPGGNCVALYSYTFPIFVNYSGRWMVNYTGYSGSGPSAPVLVNGSYAGFGPYTKSVTLTGYNNQFLTLCATAQKLDPSNSTLVLSVTGSNQTSAYYGQVTYCGGVAP
jgi:hypothetical protein